MPGALYSHETPEQLMHGAAQRHFPRVFANLPMLQLITACCFDPLPIMLSHSLK